MGVPVKIEDRPLCRFDGWGQEPSMELFSLTVSKIDIFVSGTEHLRCKKKLIRRKIKKSLAAWKHKRYEKQQSTPSISFDAESPMALHPETHPWPVMKHYILKLLILLLAHSALVAQDIPTGWNMISLKDIKLRTIDGDTFEADLNRNGRIAGKQELVRLLICRYSRTQRIPQGQGSGAWHHPSMRFFKKQTCFGGCSL